MEIGHRIKAARIKLRFSRQDLAVRAGVSIAAIYGWETEGKIPKRSSLDRLAQALGVSTGFLLEGMEPKSENDAILPRILENVRREIAVALGVSNDQIAVIFQLKA